MNEQGSKKILFNRSTLLSLKAELLKKQEEVQEKKHLEKTRLENFRPAIKTDKKDDGSKSNKRSLKDNLKAVDVEELEACRKSKLALEKKAELYEHLSDSAGNSQLATNFLVDFKEKKLQEPPKPVLVDDNYHEVPDDDEWTEFTDCLGRTRKCHKSDLQLFKDRDQQLLKATTNIPTESEVQEPQKSEKPYLVQKTNDYLQSLREKWEEKEKELLAKDKDIHYQDLLFDEARIHGVGYYSFSTDETERRKQMEELITKRQETLQAQQKVEEARKKREEMIAARVAATRARQRLKAGLPPEEPPKENQKDFTTCLLEFLTQKKNEADNQAKEKEKRLREESEKERQKLRETYIREWDLGKEGVADKVKKFREMTQEEYVEQQRAKRIDEFAPLQTSRDTDDKSDYLFDSDGKRIKSNSKAPEYDDIWSDLRPKATDAQKTWSDVRPRMKTPPPPDIGDISHLVPGNGLYFSTKKVEPTVKYKNFVKTQEYTSAPIINELDDDINVSKKDENRMVDSRHTEIAPPPTYDYYGPVAKKAKSQKPFTSNISEAYEQGMKSLESEASNRKLPKHYDFTFD